MTKCSKDNRSDDGVGVVPTPKRSKVSAETQQLCRVGTKHGENKMAKMRQTHHFYYKATVAAISRDENGKLVVSEKDVTVNTTDRARAKAKLRKEYGTILELHRMKQKYTYTEEDLFKIATKEGDPVEVDETEDEDTETEDE